MYEAINNYLPRQIRSLLDFANNSGSVRFFKISNIVLPNQENVFLVQARAGELYILSIGHSDGLSLATPKIKRLLNTYTKIQGFSWNNSDIILQVAGYSHAIIVSQIVGSSIPELTFTETTSTEYSSGTILTIE